MKVIKLSNTDIPGVVSTPLIISETVKCKDLARAEHEIREEGLTVEEKTRSGAVQWGSYAAYGNLARGRVNRLQNTSTPSIIVALLFIYVVGQGLRVCADIWITWWAGKDEDGDTPTKLRDEGNTYWAYTSALWVMANTLFAFVRSYWSTSVALTASQYAHQVAVTRFAAKHPHRYLISLGFLVLHCFTFKEIRPAGC